MLPYVRVLDTEEKVFWIGVFESFGVEVAVDMIHDVEWFKNDLRDEVNAFVFNTGGMCLLRDVESIVPAMVVICEAADAGWLWEKLVGKDRSCLKDYFLKGFVTERLVHDVEPVISMAPEELPSVDEPYSFRCKLYEEYDVKLFEVKRPRTEKPFTVLVDCFSSRGDEYFFSDIYGSKAWDSNRMECRYDFLFLQNLWGHLGLDGEFTMDVLKKRVDRCYPGEGRVAESEPIVYRSPLESVEKLLEMRRIKRVKKYFLFDELKFNCSDGNSCTLVCDVDVRKEFEFGLNFLSTSNVRFLILCCSKFDVR